MRIILILLFSIFCMSALRSEQRALVPSQSQAERISQLIWQNECKGSVEGLTSWNEGEEFASLGIGHFIWYPASKTGPFVEKFPELLAFLEQQGISLPEWLKKQKGCPWKTREEFKRDFSHPRMMGLRKLLYETRAEQALFMALRLENALDKLVQNAPEDKKEHVSQAFYRVASCPHGLYALIDYVNFKGEGVSLQERYQGEGWGLLQVLENMSDREDPIDGFVRSAQFVLARRVKNAPLERKEERWLKGWNARVSTYRCL